MLFLTEEASHFSEMLVALLAYMLSHPVDITSTVFFLRQPNEKNPKFETIWTCPSSGIERKYKLIFGERLGSRPQATNKVK